MNTTQHTPGPWMIMADPKHAGKHPFHDCRWIATADAELEYGHDPRSWGLASGSLICQMRDHVSADPEANARLIAAAPELLSACQQAEHWLTEELAKPGETYPEAILTALRAVIAKAEGAK